MATPAIADEVRIQPGTLDDIDAVMRRIPDHFHAHARDPAWPGFAWG